MKQWYSDGGEANLSGAAFEMFLRIMRSIAFDRKLTGAKQLSAIIETCLEIHLIHPNEQVRPRSCAPSIEVAELQGICSQSAY